MTYTAMPTHPQMKRKKVRSRKVKPYIKTGTAQMLLHSVSDLALTRGSAQLKAANNRWRDAPRYRLTPNGARSIQ